MTTRRIGGASRPVTSRLSHIDPPRTWGVRGTDGPIRAAVDVLVEPDTGSRSRLTISVDFTGYDIGKIPRPALMRPAAPLAVLLVVRPTPGGAVRLQRARR
jgi:hypothetical protein